MCMHAFTCGRSSGSLYELMFVTLLCFFPLIFQNCLPSRWMALSMKTSKINFSRLDFLRQTRGICHRVIMPNHSSPSQTNSVSSSHLSPLFSLPLVFSFSSILCFLLFPTLNGRESFFHLALLDSARKKRENKKLKRREKREKKTEEKREKNGRNLSLTSDG